MMLKIWLGKAYFMQKIAGLENQTAEMIVMKVKQ